MKWAKLAFLRDWMNKNEKSEPKPQAAAELLERLVAACNKNECFRQEKVQEIKARIASGDYHVSGQDVVDKWFLNSKENHARD